MTLGMIIIICGWVFACCALLGKNVTSAGVFLALLVASIATFIGVQIG